MTLFQRSVHCLYGRTWTSAHALPQCHRNVRLSMFVTAPLVTQFSLPTCGVIFGSLGLFFGCDVISFGFNFGFVFLWFLGDRLFSILIIFGGFSCMLLWCCIVLYLNMTLSRNKWVPVTTECCVLKFRMQKHPPIWRVAAKILNKHLRTADKVWSSSLGGWARC